MDASLHLLHADNPMVFLRLLLLLRWWWLVCLCLLLQVLERVGEEGRRMVRHGAAGRLVGPSGGLAHLGLPRCGRPSRLGLLGLGRLLHGGHGI